MQKARCTLTKLGWCLIFSLVGIGGCNRGGDLPEANGPEGSATGKISYQGKSITAGTVMLDSGKGYLAMAPIKPDGTFELKGADGAVFPGGEYKVAVTPPPTAPVPGATEMPKPQRSRAFRKNFTTRTPAG